MSLSVNDYIKFDLYNVFLMTKKNFNLNSLRKAYQRQVMVYHPDKRAPDTTPEEKQELDATFYLINKGCMYKGYLEVTLAFHCEFCSFLACSKRFCRVYLRKRCSFILALSFKRHY